MNERFSSPLTLFEVALIEDGLKKFKLNNPTKLEEIDSIELQSTFGGGGGGNIRNLDQVRVIASI
jgi:hypothetical protein